MTGKFSQNVLRILAFCREEAARLGNGMVAPEHIMLSMLRLEDSFISEVLGHFSVDCPLLKERLEQSVRKCTGGDSIAGHELQLDAAASDILRLAVLEAKEMSDDTINEQHILMAMLNERSQCEVKDILEDFNMRYNDILAFARKNAGKVNNGLDLPEEDDADELQESRQSHPASAPRRFGDRQAVSKTPVLDNFGIDLTQAAADGKLDPVVGRAGEIQRVSEILCRRKKSNPILIGEPGVGKSAIVEGLAQMIVQKKTSPVLFSRRIVNLDLTAIVAGTKYRGQFEERVRALVKEIEQNPNVIVFIDEIHTMVGAGSTPGSMDAANILKPALARGTMQCIGATTLDEYRNSIEKDGALERRFQKVLVEPTSVDETLLILNNIKDRYQKHHHVQYTDSAIMACVNMTDRYVSDRFFPDKAIDVMDEVGARMHLSHVQVPPVITEKQKELDEMKHKKQTAVLNQNFELAASYRDRQCSLEAEIDELQKKYAEGDIDTFVEVTDIDVAQTVSMMTGVPLQQMTQAETVRLKDMASQLKQAVIAQDDAIEKVVKAIQRNRIGLKAPGRPIGAFMFLGPTGVGKTYLAKKLAELMFGSADSIIRVDMSEYSESFNTSRLVGAPPGYVGYEQGGQLTEKVRRHPYSIVLLDEIEKAHGNVFNMLLQVLDEGRLTDGNGRLIDFRNTIVIMTSNAGTRQLKEFGKGIGFSANMSGDLITGQNRQYARSIIQKSLSKQFSPEFLNRLDEIVTFEQLGLDAIKRIIDLELRQLFTRVEEMGYHITITDKAKELVATKGYDVQYGARPLKRAIQNYIEDGVCEMLLDGKLTEGNTIQIGKNHNKEELTFKVG